VHACHRLDRDVSGICLLATHPRVAHAVRDDPKRHLRERVYAAVVEGAPKKPADTIRSYLRDDADQVVRPVQGPGEGKLSITHFRVAERGERYSLLEVSLETGRKNQIRAHMAERGHPIAGDRKYGARTDPLGRVALHATRLTVVHPVTGETLRFRSNPPASFRAVVTAAPHRTGR
jgi:23S rRNA pseudouridine1911/1915/1917 synthase